MMKNKTVLIVDDTTSNLDMLINLLCDYDIIQATNGKDAIEILEDEKVDLVLLDIVMPEMDGYQVCTLVKNNNKTKHIPIIFLTVINDEISIEKAYNAGGFDYITKPFKPKELLHRVKTQLHLDELKKKESEYHKQVALSELINNIAHHWRQPLSSISTLASGLSLKKELGIIEEDEIINCCKNIVNQTQYLSTTLDTISTLLNKTHNTESFNIKESIQTYHYILFKKTLKENITLDLHIDEKLSINESENEFISIITALVQNSLDILQTVPENKRVIFLHISKKEEHILLEFYDTGLGVNEKNLKRIFEPYFTTKHQSKGKGLSLFLVENIISKIFNGSIDAYNHEFLYEEEAYKGLKFDILLPF